MNQHDKHRDDERDAWLAQALRHAPDANADAPPALSDIILREARAAAPRPATPAAPSRSVAVGPLQRLASAWDWLARPPVAAGFASVMVATLVGVMWWDRPLDESLPRAPEVVSSTPPARAEPTPDAAVAAAPAAPEAKPAPAEPPTPKPATTNHAPAAQGRLAETKDAAKSARAVRPDAELARARGAADAAPAAAEAVPPPVAFPAAPPAPAPAANEEQAPRAQRRELAAPATRAPAESSAPAAAAADKAAPLRNDLRAAPLGSAGSSLAKARAADADAAPLATPRPQIAQQPERWRWQRGNGTPQPMNAAVQAWLAELDRQTASRWQTGAGSTARAPASTLRLFRDGVLQATFGVAGSAVWAETPGAAVAPLPESTAESLRKALDDATP